MATTLLTFSEPFAVEVLREFRNVVDRVFHWDRFGAALFRVCMGIARRGMGASSFRRERMGETFFFWGVGLRIYRLACIV